MMDDLREMVSDFTDERLLEMHAQRAEYTEEAFRIIETEVTRRGLDPNAPIKAAERTERAIAAADASVASLSRDDFAVLPGLFSRADVLTANAVLFSSKVPYTIEKCDENEGPDCPAMFKILVYNDALSTALELIEEHFELDGNGQYILRKSDIVDRLKSFNVYDIKMSDKAVHERLDVEFTKEESAELINLAEVLIDETDKIEEEQGRVVFFYDGLEPLIDKLRSNDGFTRTDFLAIIELCQIYCDDPRYDPALNGVVASILDFFVG